MQDARGKLNEHKAVARERSKEMQRHEARRRELEKEKAESLLGMKEVEHRVAKFHKDSREAAAKVGG